jgi:hypothetical protein
MTRRHTLALALAVLLAAPALASAAPVERRLHSNSLEASSFLWNDWNKFQENYHPNYVADDDPRTAWVEGAESSGAGEWLRINVTPLDKTSGVRLKIRNGYQKSAGLFKANARAKDVTVRLLPSRVETKATLTDKNGWQELSLAQPAGPVSAIELKVGSVYEGTRYADLCISDVQVFATSETPDNPAFEKSKRKALLDWRKARVAAAKLFAKKKVEVPFLPAYKVKSTEVNTCKRCDLAGVVEFASADPAFAEWKAELAVAAATVAELDKLPRSQIAPRSREALVDVDGLKVPTMEEYAIYIEPDGLVLPILGTVSSLFADQLRVLDIKDTLTPTAFRTAMSFDGDPRECKGDVTWVKRKPSAEKTGPATAQAVVVGVCGEVEERGGSALVSTLQVLVYGEDGKLALVFADGHLDAFRWAIDGGQPIIVGGRSIHDGDVIEVSKQQ